MIDPDLKVVLFLAGGLPFLKILSRFFGVFVIGYIASLHCFASLLRFASLILLLRFFIASLLYCFASLRHWLYVNLNNRQQTTTNVYKRLFEFKLCPIYRASQGLNLCFAPVLYISV